MALRNAVSGMLLCCQLSVSSSHDACPDGVCPGLGHAFYLPNPSSYSSGGRVFLKNTKLGECANLQASETSTRALKIENSMRELVESTNTEFGLSGSYTAAVLTAKGNVQVKTSTSSDITTSFHSTNIDITYISQEVFLEQSTRCLGDESNIDPAFLMRFKSLGEISAERVHESTSWAPYVNFLKDQGSHLMIRQSLGSRFQQWESSQSSSSDIAKTLQVKACANVEGLSAGGGWSVKSCAAYGDSEKKTALRTESKSHRVISGGTTVARRALLNSLTKETLANFIQSAPQGDLPVAYGFKPIWETLITFYNRRCVLNGASSIDCKHRQRAYNLQAAYEGWLATGCPKLTTSNGVVYQSMAISNPSAEIQTYQCDAAKTGCYSDDDCHIGGAGSVCYCYGPSCIDTGNVVTGSAINRSKVRGSEAGNYYTGVNNACYYHAGVYCKCDKSWAGGLRQRQLYVQGQPSFFITSSNLSVLV